MAVVPASHTFVDGVAPTSEANTYIRDPIAFALNPPRAELRQNVAQTLTTGVGAMLTWDIEDLDTDVDAIGGHDTAVNPSRYTVRYAGWYQVSGVASFVANSTGRRITYIAVNGSIVNGTEMIFPASATGSSHAATRTKHIYLNVGDYVEIQATQDSGGNLATSSGFGPSNSSMSVRWVSN